MHEQLRHSMHDIVQYKFLKLLRLPHTRNTLLAIVSQDDDTQSGVSGSVSELFSDITTWHFYIL